MEPSHRSDLWCCGAAPKALYAGLLTVAVLTFWLRAAWAPLAMAALLLALLLISIRNAWDLIAWIAPTRRD